MKALKQFIPIIFLSAVTAACLFPSLFNEFTDWDDHLYVAENPFTKDFSLKGLWRLFAHPLVSNYHPITMLSLWIQYGLSGLDPFPYHLINLIFHLFNVTLVFVFTRLIGQSGRVSFVVALFFGIHPLHVESVAWVAQRKDVLCAFFYLLSLICYIRHLNKPGIFLQVTSFFLFILACLSKPMAVTLPLILLVIEIWKKKTFHPSMIYSKIHFFLIAIMTGIITLVVQKESGAMTGYQIEKELWLITHVALKGLVFYLRYTIFPVGLSALYPMPLAAGAGEMAVNAGVLALALGLVYALRKRNPTVVFGAAFFILTIFPVLKFVPVGDAFAADRYHYIPSIGLFLICAAIIERLYARAILKNKGAAFFIVAFIPVVSVWFGYLTFERSKVWKDSFTLFEDMLKKNPNHNLPYNNLGFLYQEKGDSEKAIYFFKEASRRSDLPGININLANEYLNAGRFSEGEKLYRKIMRDWPGEIGAYNGMAIVHSKYGQNKEALACYQKALQIDPRDASIHNNIGYLFYRMGDLESSTDHYLKAINLQSDYITAYRNLIINYEDLGRYGEARKVCLELLKILEKAGDQSLAGEYKKTLKRFGE